MSKYRLLKKGFWVVLITNSTLFGASDYEGVTETKKIVDITYNTNVINNTAEHDSFLTSDKKTDSLVGFDYYGYKKVKGYSIPFAKYLQDRHLLFGSVNYLDNDITQQKGTGDTSLGYAYKMYLANKNITSITGISVGIPTGSHSKGLGLGAYSKTLSQSVKTKIVGVGMYASVAYTIIGDSDEYIPDGSSDARVIDYGNRFTAILGLERELSDIGILVKGKLVYYKSASDDIDYTNVALSNSSYNNDATYVDLDVNLGYKISRDSYISFGINNPLSTKYGSGITNIEPRDLSYYVTLVTKY
jgi:hypothetical protein